jgi:hypothetical protein
VLQRALRSAADASLRLTAVSTARGCVYRRLVSCVVAALTRAALAAVFASLHRVRLSRSAACPLRSCDVTALAALAAWLRSSAISCVLHGSVNPLTAVAAGYVLHGAALILRQLRSAMLRCCGAAWLRCVNAWLLRWLHVLSRNGLPAVASRTTSLRSALTACGRWLRCRSAF